MMKPLILFIIVLIIGPVLIVYGQGINSKKHNRKSEKLEQKAALRALVSSQYFYIDNYQLFDRYQNTRVLAASNNFIRIKGDDV